MTKKGSSKEVEEWVATVQVLKEGAFDVASHMLSELLGSRMKMSLVSCELDPETKEPKISPYGYLSFSGGEAKDVGGDSWITVKFPNVPKDFGKPGALLVESHHDNEFFLKAVTLETAIPIHFACQSWITHCRHNSNRPRIFFPNQGLLPKDTPEALVNLRSEDLSLIRGDGKGERDRSERIYDYDVYNDLGNPDNDKALKRPTLGGSQTLPYPRRCRTGRNRNTSDSKTEKTVFFDDGYVPRDERFSTSKMNLFMGSAVNAFGREVLPYLNELFDNDNHFDTFQDVYELYQGGLRSVKTFQGLFEKQSNKANIQFPPPAVVQDAWAHDLEFGRQRLAGLNPFLIQPLTEFPMTSELDPLEYGPSTSTITSKDIELYLEGLSVEEAIKQKRLFVLDFHDAVMPYVNKINMGTNGRIYASRTVLFLTRFNMLNTIAIELSLPPPKKGLPAWNRVYKAPPPGITNWEWRLARAHVAAVDAGIHQLVSHWLRTHACVEPFAIATHRQLSTMHPLHVLLSPHFKDTMNINAMARSSLINANGIIEKSFSPGPYSLEISSIFYKSWRFDEQALPNDLIKRGMAVEDSTAKHGVKLLLDDYPFAKDGLDVWAAIKKWVMDYVGIYYKADSDVQEDPELQAWWKEVTEIGHGDHKGAPWWGHMKTIEELVQALSTLIWVASAHHAAVNFGQYAYAGFFPNCPTACVKLMPEPGSKEYETFSKDPEAYFLQTVSSAAQALTVISTVELLSTRFGEEEYLGQRSDPQWTSDPRALDALERFAAALSDIDAQVSDRNCNAAVSLFNRAGPALVPYTLLSPNPAPADSHTSDPGMTGSGIPNSISI
ncbi:hypothetical protein KP509_38G012900 [Ceratopteris richardii]|uniref:Lipoxygenase n=1 Tax=Ceratopteris richardii TaxID=49495 RepID=A0A8T2Q1Q8_CERRI|nr:hypothetical protein KP509_38G012900 [Ceratopteris richardii]